mmetsp:Transcript_6575/g.29682  ORF Transcript_6575/g.29682 Transcript_6575/m.29682 type:complete len:417 (-) Transcript_6575:950-2200(-)
MKCGRRSPVDASSTGKYLWCLRMTITNTSLGSSRNAGSNPPMMGVGDSIRFTTSSMRPPDSPADAGTTPSTLAASVSAADQMASRRASKLISIVSPSRRLEWCAELVTSAVGVGLLRRRRVVEPDATPTATKGRWYSPCMARSQRRGRLKVASPFHLIVLGKLTPPTMPGRASARTSCAARPTVRTLAHTYSPSFSNAAGSIPFFFAKPIAALVGVTPSSSKARESGGPLLRSSLLSCAATRSLTLMTMRRGVAPTTTPPWVRPAASRHASTALASCSDPDATSAGGSSSVPTSRKKSAAPVGAAPFGSTGSGVGVGSQTPRGNPSSSRLATQSTADSRASFLMLAKSFCRSVTPTAPLASKMLNACEALRSWSNAGRGSLASSMRLASLSASSNLSWCAGTSACSMLNTDISYSF